LSEAVVASDRARSRAALALRAGERRYAGQQLVHPVDGLRGLVVPAGLGQGVTERAVHRAVVGVDRDAGPGGLLGGVEVVLAVLHGRQGLEPLVVGFAVEGE